MAQSQVDQKTIQLTSSAFKQGEPIPSPFTCDGKNISPALEWDSAPAGAASLALITDDPDAPGKTWVHWVIFNIPPDSTNLKEDVAKLKTLPDGALQGTNSFDKIGYGGPCPPSGQHRYFFKLYALDIKLTLGSRATKQDVERAMKGHILGKGELMGTYQRPR